MNTETFDLLTLWEDNKDWVIPAAKTGAKVLGSLLVVNAVLLRYSYGNDENPSRGQKIINAALKGKFKTARKHL